MDLWKENYASLWNSRYKVEHLGIFYSGAQLCIANLGNDAQVRQVSLCCLFSVHCCNFEITAVSEW
jgi:hypothetical protein